MRHRAAGGAIETSIDVRGTSGGGGVRSCSESGKEPLEARDGRPDGRILTLRHRFDLETTLGEERGGLVHATQSLEILDELGA